MSEKLTVFFDGGCPLCSREITHYRRIEEPGRIRWVDITRDREALRDHGLEETDAMASFHVRSADGRWHTGAEAFIALWQHLPRYRWLANACEALRLRRPMNAVYRRFARWRFAKRCAEGACRA